MDMSVVQIASIEMESEAYSNGYLAACDETSYRGSSNPYPEDSTGYDDWENGYNDYYRGIEEYYAMEDRNS